MIPDSPMVIAHRGASSYAPENTLASFDLAVQMGISHIELDVQTTADGHVVVIHDDTVDRTTDGSGAVADCTLAELCALDAGAWFAPEFAGQRIPTYDEVLERYNGKVHLHTEIKGSTSDLVQRTVDLIRKHNMSQQVTITSFQQVRLEETRAYASELPTGWLVGQVSDEIVETTLSMGLNQLCPRADQITLALVQQLHGRGLMVRAWGVTDEALMRHVADAGADGMTVNFPDKLVAYLEEKNKISRG